METIVVNSSSEHSISPHKHENTKNPKRNTRHFIESLAPLNTNPPLLSLPMTSRTREPSCSPPPNRKKSKLSSPSPRKEDTQKKFSSRITTNMLGPDTIDLPEDSVVSCTILADLEKFSGSVFTLSPSPSSLPLPTFSLRPKLRCAAEAAEFDAGATDNLRRLLKLS